MPSPLAVRLERAADLTEEARARAAHELELIASVPALAPAAEAWIETLLAVPAGPVSRESVDVRAIRDDLAIRFVGQDAAKDWALGIAAADRAGSGAEPVTTCFVGPQGSGRRSFATALAELLGRPFVRVALAGASASDLLGRRRARRDAGPGLILDAVIRSGSRAPLLYLDGGTALGLEAAEALVRVLDTRSAFVDEYLGVPVDLSDALIVVASSDGSICGPLHNRLRFVHFERLTATEQVAVARRTLLPAALLAHGMDAHRLRVPDAVIARIIERFILDGGLGRLEKEIQAIVAWAAGRDAGGLRRPRTVTIDDLPAILHRPGRSIEPVGDRPLLGGTFGVSVTSGIRGQIVRVETATYPGREETIITGRLGETMRESARVALSVVRSRGTALGIEPPTFRDRTLHLHIPPGGDQVDGPSAGAAMAVAIASRFSGRRVRPDVAMTGELDLDGRILAIGGVHEKLDGAIAAGARTFLLPAANLRDLHRVPAAVIDAIRIIPVERIEQVFDAVLEPRRPAPPAPVAAPGGPAAMPALPAGAAPVPPVEAPAEVPSEPSPVPADPPPGVPAPDQVPPAAPASAPVRPATTGAGPTPGAALSASLARRARP